MVTAVGRDVLWQRNGGPRQRDGLKRPGWQDAWRAQHAHSFSYPSVDTELYSDVMFVECVAI